MSDLRERVARQLRRKTISNQIWDSARIGAAIERYETQRDDVAFEDLVEDVRRLLRAYRRAAGLRSTAPRSAERRVFRRGQFSTLESAKALAYSEALASIAFQSYEAQRFWTECLRRRWLTPEEADQFYASPAVRLVPFWHFVGSKVDLPGLRSEFVQRELRGDGSWTVEVVLGATGERFSVNGSILPGHGPSGIVSAGFIEGHAMAKVRSAKGNVWDAGYWTGSLLDELCGWSARLAERIGWEECEASWFLLTGYAPHFKPMTGQIANDFSGRITINVSPWVSDQTLLHFMRQMRLAALGKVSPRTSAVSFDVFTFVTRAETVRGGETPKWRALLEEWNVTVATQYRFRDVKQMRARYTQALRVIRRYVLAAQARGLGRMEMRRLEQQGPQAD